MPNTKSIVATVVSEFTLYLGDCKQDSYDFNIEVRPAGDLNTTFVRLLLQGDGLADFLRRGGKVDAQFRPYIGKAHKPDESDNHKDKQKLEEFA